MAVVAGGVFATPQAAYAADEGTAAAATHVAAAGHVAVAKDVVVAKHVAVAKRKKPGGSGYGNGAAPGAAAVPSSRPYVRHSHGPAPAASSAVPRPTKTPSAAVSTKVTARPSTSAAAVHPHGSTAAGLGVVPRPGMPTGRTLNGLRESGADVVLTAAWDADSVPDSLPDLLHLHLIRADSTAPVSGLAFTITLPAGLTVTSPSVITGCTATIVDAFGGSTVAVTAGELAIGEGDCAIDVSAFTDTSGVYALPPSSVSGATGIVNGVTTQTLTVVPALPRIAGSFSPTTIDAGGLSTLTIGLSRTDHNMSTSASGLGLRITLPDNLFVSSTGTNTCGGTVSGNGRVISIYGAALPNGPTDCRFTTVVTSDAGAVYRVTTSTVDDLRGIASGFKGKCGVTEGTGETTARFGAPSCVPTLRVDKLDQSITFAQPADTSVSMRTLTPPATSTSGLKVNLTSTTHAVCTASGDTITLVGPGTCTIAADQPGDSAYTAATTVTQSFTVGPATAPPSHVVATAGVSSINVTWDAPGDLTGVTGYTASASPGPATCTTKGALTCVLGGTAGTTYTISVVANNSRGDSVAAGPSDDVTPTAPAVTATPPETNLVLTTDKGLITTAVPSQDIVVIGTGFAAHSTATIVIYSDPTVLGTVITDALGNFSKPVTVPASLAVGSHTLIAAGVDPGGAPHSMKLALQVPPLASGTGGGGALAVTGAPVDALVLTGIAFLLTGTGLSTVGRRRRRLA
jgi:titin